MLKNFIRYRKPEDYKSRSIYMYETYLAEYFMLIADIEVGIVSWNKFRLSAFRVKDVKEVHHYVMYTKLLDLDITPNSYVYKWDYKFKYQPIEEDRFG